MKLYNINKFIKMTEGFINEEFSSNFICNEYLSRSEIKKNNKEYSLQVTVPGCGPENVDVLVERQTLRVKSEKQRFERKYSIPKEVDKDRIAATLRHGLLDITLPLLLENDIKSRKIDVK